MKHTAQFAILAAVLFAGTAAFAADTDKGKGTGKQTVMRDGTVVEDAYILDKKPNGITLAYKDGCMFIRFSDMPLEYQKAFGYDPIKSARYEKKLDEQKKAYEKEEEKLKAAAKSARPRRTSTTRTAGSASSSRRSAGSNFSSKRRRNASKRPKRPSVRTANPWAFPPSGTSRSPSSPPGVTAAGSGAAPITPPSGTSS